MNHIIKMDKDDLKLAVEERMLKIGYRPQMISFDYDPPTGNPTDAGAGISASVLVEGAPPKL